MVGIRLLASFWHGHDEACW